MYQQLCYYILYQSFKCNKTIFKPKILYNVYTTRFERGNYNLNRDFQILKTIRKIFEYNFKYNITIDCKTIYTNTTSPMFCSRCPSVGRHEQGRSRARKLYRLRLQTKEFLSITYQEAYSFGEQIKQERLNN